MPKLNDMIPSKFLKQDDIHHDTLVTIKALKQDKVDADETRWTMIFEELDKPLVLNKTNLKRAAKAMESDDTDDWIGRKIVIYVDENVEYAGEIVGGLRLKAAKNQPKPAPKPAPGIEEMYSGVPF